MSYSGTKSRKSNHLVAQTNASVKRLKTAANEKNFYWSRLILRFIVFCIAVTACYLHWFHVSNLHENDLFFSHLSNMERELTFRTEMGFYYSYFKQMILAPTYMDAFNSLLTDSRTEYPPCLNLTGNTDNDQDVNCSKLNAIERFNLFPELLLAGAYRYLNSIGLIKRYCFQVKRDPPVHPIAIAIDSDVMKNSAQLKKLDVIPTHQLKISNTSIISCEGSGEPPYFYVNSVFILSGLILFGLTYSGWLIARFGSVNRSKSELFISLFGAFIPVLAYFSNHREATRVQWTPPLRESFAYPFFVLQQAFLLSQFRSQKMLPSSLLKTFISSLAYCILLLGFQLPWQFAQFALLTQIISILCALFITLTANPPNSIHQKSITINLLLTVKRILRIHLFVFNLSFILQYGNRLLLQSGYLFCLFGSLLTVYILQQLIETFDIMKSNEKKKKKKKNELLSTFSSILHTPFIRFLCLPVIITCIATVGFGIIVSCLLKYTSVGGNNLSPNDDGGHIWDLLKHKLSIFVGTGYKTFHTMLYVCAPEFDFISWMALKQPFETGLLFGAILACCIACFKPVKSLFTSSNTASTPTHAQSSSNDNYLNYGYTFKIFRDFISLLVIIQMLIFTVMAVFIMRLKLFWTPQMCLSLAILAQSSRWFDIFYLLKSVGGRIFCKPTSNDVCKPEKQKNVQNRVVYIIYTVLVLFVAFMGVRGLENVKSEWKIQGSFSNYENEVLIGWFRNLPQKYGNSSSWIISGPMSLLGNLRLTLPASAPYPSTQSISINQSGFAFTNHPHYENTILRHRTILAYAIYSRRPVHEVWRIYRYSLKTDFVIVEGHTCPPRGGCSKPELYDLLDPQLIGQPALCESLLSVQVSQTGKTPSILKPYFTVVYVESYTNRVVLYVNKLD
ncbi:unnamed protein product [Trichobilharzia szidati]|nr:unnamed protein product [Trichobilharzia szidati]